MRVRNLALLLQSLISVPGVLLGATIRVPLMEPTIQAGVDAAVSGDTVLVAPGIYRGNENKRISFNGRDLVLVSETGAQSTIIDVEGFAEPDQAFRIEHGESAAAVIDGFTVRHGYLETGSGAGMSIGNSSPTVRNCIFLDNWMGSAFNDVLGGAVAVGNGSPMFANCSFINNRVEYFGQPPGFGSIGGAMYCRDSSVQLTNCTFQSNSAIGVGFSGAGGAIGSIASSLSLTNCRFVGNLADIEGGGLVVSGSDAIVDETIFAFNEAGGTAGGIMSAGSTIQAMNCTFYGNGAVEGGGFFLTNSNALIKSTIIAFSERGGAIRCVSQAPATLHCTDIFGNAGGDWTEPCIAGQFGIQGNLSLDPLFCNGEGGNFYLHANSPCASLGPTPGCGLIGALDVGCSVSAVSEGVSSPVVQLQLLRNPVREVAEFTVFPHPAQVLGIYSVSGRLIDELLVAPGATRVLWHPKRSTPPGVYVAALRSGKETRTAKFILLPR